MSFWGAEGAGDGTQGLLYAKYILHHRPTHGLSHFGVLFYILSKKSKLPEFFLNNNFYHWI